MKLKELQIEEISDLQQYSVFNSQEWLRLFDNAKIIGIFDKGDNLVGNLNFQIQDMFGFKIIRNLPCTPFIGPFLEISAQKQSTKQDYYKKVLTLIAEYFETQTGVKAFSLCPEICDTQPFTWKKFNVTPRYTYNIDLNYSEEEIWNAFLSERRKNITKAEKDELGVKRIFDSELQLVKELVLKTFSRQNKRISLNLIDKILFDFSNDTNSFAFVSYKYNCPISAAFCVYDDNKAYYLLGGYDEDQKHNGAGSVALWECIKLAKKMGIKDFDFEGSMIPSVERYFRGFGGNLTPYYSIKKFNIFGKPFK